MTKSNTLFPKNNSKYSDTFYRNILLRISIVIILITSILLLFFLYQTIEKQMTSSQQSLAIENEDCYSNVNDVFTDAKNISMFFAMYKDLSALYQSELNTNVQKAMLLEEAKSFIACFDFLNRISVNTPDFHIAHGASASVEHEEIQALDPFVVYATTANSFPPLIKLSYNASDADTFDVEVSMFSKFISEHCVSKNSYLISNSGRILLANDYDLLGKQITDLFSISVDTIREGRANHKYLHSETFFSDDGMILVSLTPKTDIYKNILGQLLSIVLLYFIVSAICILILFYILDYLYRPIKNVAQALKYYMPDNDSLLESDALCIKQCMDHYTSNEDIDAALLKIRQNQLSILHSQISPHLIGNTLETIKCDIVRQLGFDTKLEHSIVSLSTLLQESYAFKNLITSIGAEIERTKLYTDMMLYSFFERLNVEWDVAEDVLDCMIVTLTLQPFIENSIEHGFTRKEKNPRILIRISSDNENIFIEIEDNGVGMDQESLSAILHSLRDDGVNSKHIGIKNSHLKLKLLFGDEYGVTDIQSDGNGTYAKLTLPKIEAPKGISTS